LQEPEEEMSETHIAASEFGLETGARRRSRREALRIFSAAAAVSLVTPDAWLAGLQAQPAPGAIQGCVVRPKQTEGPYFVDRQLQRDDLRVDPATGLITPGVPLTLAINLASVDGANCRPLAGAVVDVWQCDAHGQYSGVVDRTQGFDTSGTQFLRGYQVSDREGRVEFTTIYPGWYPGRAVHIHFKVRTSQSSGRAGEFTSQWYFDDQLTDTVLASGPYAEKQGRRQRNDRDRIYQRGGKELMLNVSKTATGYTGTFDLGVQLA
jgi:protocatechuate 3,4-dioxygenase beta subunit